MEPEPRPFAEIDGTVAQALRQHRQRLGVPPSLLDVAIGSAFGTVERIEAGDRRATASELFRLAAVLGIQVDAFFDPPGADGPVVEPAPFSSEKTANDERVAIEAQRFIRAFARLTDPVVRARVITMVEELAQLGSPTGGVRDPDQHGKER